MIQIIICDDHKIVRAGLIELLNDYPEMQVVADVGSGEELLQLLEKVEADIILLDLSLPGKSGLDILKQIKVRYPDLPVLILSTHKEEQYAVRTIKAHASGYLHKDSDPDELIKAIRSISQGRKYVSDKLVGLLLRSINKNFPNPHDILSDREHEVMVMLAEGMVISEIARDLAVSPNTVSTYKARIMEKMDFESIAELFRYVTERNLSGSSM